jgi:hypothetical protein
MAAFKSLEAYRDREARYKTALESYKKLVEEYEATRASDAKAAAAVYEKLTAKRLETEQLFTELSEFRQEIAAPVSIL